MVATKMRFFKPAKVRSIIETMIPDGQIFTVVFLRKCDGAKRTMNCRQGVSLGVTGTGRKPSPSVVTVFDLSALNTDGTKGAWRSFSVSRVLEIRADGVSFRPTK